MAERRHEFKIDAAIALNVLHWANQNGRRVDEIILGRGLVILANMQQEDLDCLLDK